ncbi:acylphosphatase [Patescibacteria group bacterium]|nr:acylphosphatase [Patescibacteria group bacterium]MBU1970228.1 acylphosphatase [Patescibacteria group bacterium]
MTEAKMHKVNMRVKGNLRHLTYKLHALLEATRLGLKTNKLIKHQPGCLELEFEGEKRQLWKIIKWAKGRKPLSIVDEIMFTFS